MTKTVSGTMLGAELLDGSAMILVAFTCRNKIALLEIPGPLYERVHKLGRYLRKGVTDILSLACSNYGVSVEAVEKYLANDMKEEMKIAEGFEL